jgi:hypothetical protein
VLPVQLVLPEIATFIKNESYHRRGAIATREIIERGDFGQFYLLERKSKFVNVTIKGCALPDL